MAIEIEYYENEPVTTEMGSLRLPFGDTCGYLEFTYIYFIQLWPIAGHSTSSRVRKEVTKRNTTLMVGVELPTFTLRLLTGGHLVIISHNMVLTVGQIDRQTDRQEYLTATPIVRLQPKIPPDPL